MFSKVFKVVSLAAVLPLSGLPALQAATATSSFTVSATVTESCQIVSASTMAFPSFNALASADIDQTSTLSLRCTNTTPYNIGLSAGGGSGATVGTRKMSNGGETLNYTVYRDSSHSQIWGNTVATDTLASVGTGSNQSHTLYGRVFSSGLSSVIPGSYSDSVTVTVTY
jgi:spore coat protein U-like protein